MCALEEFRVRGAGRRWRRGSPARFSAGQSLNLTIGVREGVKQGSCTIRFALPYSSFSEPLLTGYRSPEPLFADSEYLDTSVEEQSKWEGDHFTTLGSWQEQSPPSHPWEPADHNPEGRSHGQDKGHT